MKLSERYHPERFRMLNPLARQISTIYQSLSGQKMATYETFQKIIDLIMQTYNKTIKELPIEQRPDNLRTLYRYGDAAMHYAAFCSFGRQIFHFNNEIVEQFRKTDIDEVLLESLRFPYEVFYMSFGKQMDLKLWNKDYFVDGAYISMFNIKETSLQIFLTTDKGDKTASVPSQVFDWNFSADNGLYLPKPAKQDPKFDWIFQPEEHYYLSIPVDDLSQPILRDVEKALNEEFENRKKAAQKPPPPPPGPGKVVINRRPETEQREMKELEEGYPIFKEALKLIINGLCYISVYPDDIETQWPADTPQALLEKIDTAKKPKEIARASSKLLSMGYTKIHFCGRAFERLDKSSFPTGKEIKAHWRRGHWRNQACGPQLLKRKLIWIMPVIVHKDKADNLADAGHVYYVGEN